MEPPYKLMVALPLQVIPAQFKVPLFELLLIFAPLRVTEAPSAMETFTSAVSVPEIVMPLVAVAYLSEEEAVKFERSPFQAGVFTVMETPLLRYWSVVMAERAGRVPK